MLYPLQTQCSFAATLSLFDRHLLDQYLSQCSRQLTTFLHVLISTRRVLRAAQYTLIDTYLYDIPLAEWLYTREFRPRHHLRLADLADDRTAMKMTSFSIAQLGRLYHHFCLRQFVHAHGETELRIGTNNFDAITGREKCYLIDPEELFMYSLTRIKTGMTQEAIIDMYFGGDYNRWSYGHRWFMCYLDNRYFSIIGHEGILRFLRDDVRWHEDT